MKAYSSQTPNHIEFLQILGHFPQMIFWVSANEDMFLGCNSKFANFAGLKDSTEIIGSNGLKYFGQRDVLLFRDYKTQVLNTKEEVQVSEEIKSIGTDNIAVNLTLAPILDPDNNVSSIICYGTLILQLSDKNWSDAIKLITRENISKLLGGSNKFPVNTSIGLITLTRREAECSLFIMKGLTAKAIADEIFLAQRTVINHIENIKDKLGCTKRSELITALTNGDFINNNF
ncbi:MAG: helix-turn-helix transcriptional regulator [Francisellaceae bacterium]|jgi:DNA-binding CsgD family transcriptional regulator|nr:helix-turn-helix transcriptional regulator [Francisellaceae bacterium]MBT6208348.1 helix-turn-helix transcriptional regulator [Francisellaceae bacterium]MBT6539156.1 helix-turn-helix transcriptional regulator [Francisellaceae bacterium]